MPLPNNLDYFVAEAAMKFEDGQENAIQKAISILSSQGLFAMFLWSYGKNDYTFVAKTFVDIFREADLISFQQTDTRDVLNKLKENLQSLNKIRFFEDLAMRILIYARHYLKAVSARKV